jgi:5-methylcytosine-specific restriction endonuclease McrA
MTKEQRSAWRKANPEKHREEQRQCYARNKLEIGLRISLFKSAHPKRACMYTATRNTRKTQAGGFTTPAQWLRICRAVKFRCLCCSKRKRLTVDHVIPICKGGTSWPNNLQPLCKTCNSKKRTKSTDFRFCRKWRTIFTRLFARKWFCSESKTCRASVS